MEEYIKPESNAGLQGLRLKELMSMGEGWTLTPVPREKRRHWIEMVLILWGFLLTLSGLVFGAQLLVGVGSWGGFVSALLITFILVTILTGFHGSVGTETGLNSTVLARVALGEYGSILYSITLSLVTMVWFGFHVDIFSTMISNFLPALQPFKVLVCAIVGILMTLITLLGYRGLAAIAYVAVPLLFILLLWLSFTVANWAPPVELVKQLALQAGAAPITVATAVTMMTGYLWQGAPDLCRFSRNKKEAWAAVTLLYVVGIVFAFGVGAAIIAGVGNHDILWCLTIGLGLGVVFLLPALLLEWTTNDTNLYMIGLALNNVFRLKDHRSIVLIAGLAGTYIGITGVIYKILDLALFFSISIPPLMALTVCDYWILGRRDLREMFKYAKVPANWHAIVSWIVAFAVGYFTPSVFPGVNSVNSVIAAIVVYWVLMKAHGLSFYKDLIANSAISVDDRWLKYADQMDYWKQKGWV